jgi:hypothetical protein
MTARRVEAILLQEMGPDQAAPLARRIAEGLVDPGDGIFEVLGPMTLRRPDLRMP